MLFKIPVVRYLWLVDWCFVCLCGVVCSVPAWTSLMHCVTCSRPADTYVQELLCGCRGSIRKISQDKSYYKSSSVCLFVCLFVPYLLRGPLTDLRQTWWVYAGGPRNCPWGVLFRKRQRVDGSTGHFRFPLYYIYASLTPHSCKRRLCCYCI